VPSSSINLSNLELTTTDLTMIFKLLRWQTFSMAVYHDDGDESLAAGSSLISASTALCCKDSEGSILMEQHGICQLSALGNENSVVLSSLAS
jgi:hypothetical protein